SFLRPAFLRSLVARPVRRRRERSAATTAQMVASAMLLVISGRRSMRSRTRTTAPRTDPRRSTRAVSPTLMTPSVVRILMTMAERLLSRGDRPIETRLSAPLVSIVLKAFRDIKEAHEYSDYKQSIDCEEQKVRHQIASRC